jgi:hypothetical protein
MIIKHDFGNSARPGGLSVAHKDAAGPTFPQSNTLQIGFGTAATIAGYKTKDHGFYLSITRFLDLSATAFQAINPRMVLSPLFGQGHDAVDIARKLAELGFAGSYHALAADLPDSAMVAREIRAANPAMNFQITERGG